jgi:hypothetical protein
MKNEEAVKTPKAAYVPPTLQKQQLIEEVLGQFLTSHGVG